MSRIPHEVVAWVTDMNLKRWVVLILATTALVMVFPEIALWLPRTMR